MRARDVGAAFKAYDEIRRPRSQKVVRTSKEAAYLLCLCMEGVGDDEARLKETLNERLHWLWDLDPMEQVEEARRKMLEYLKGKSV